MLGNVAAQHPQAAQLHALAQWLAEPPARSSAFYGEAANSVGGYLAGAVPGSGGLNARAMFAEPRKAICCCNVEPELDCADPRSAMRALARRRLVSS